MDLRASRRLLGCVCAWLGPRRPIQEQVEEVQRRGSVCHNGCTRELVELHGVPERFRALSCSLAVHAEAAQPVIVLCLERKRSKAQTSSVRRPTRLRSCVACLRSVRSLLAEVARCSQDDSSVDFLGLWCESN